MAITREVLDAADRVRRSLAQINTNHLVELAGAWAGAWDSIAEDFEEAIGELVNQGAGRLTRTQVSRNRRIQATLEQVAEVLSVLYEESADLVAGDLLYVVRSAVEGQQLVLQGQLPPAPATGPAVGLQLNAPSPDALNAIVARSTETIHSLSRPLPAVVVEKMKQELVRGIALGKNPEAVGRRILRNVEGEFNGGLTRAVTIARTEILDAHRQATRELAKSNTDILAGWLWSCTLDVKTCPSCLSKHGTLHPVGEFGPIDHQNGRCARIDKVKTWKELGLPGEEPEDDFPNSQEWFRGLNESAQREIMGPTRLQLLKDGKIAWSDLSQRRNSPGWRDSQVVTPVRDLLDKSKEATP